MKIIILILLAFQAQGVELLQSPKAGEFSTATISPNLSPRLVSLIAPHEDTNSYTRIPFAWDYDPNQFVDGFEVVYGPSNSFWTNMVMTESSETSFTFSKTNWMEEGQRHFYTVRSVVLSFESDDANIVFFPPYPADRVDLSWQGAARQIEASSDLKTWIGITNSTSPCTFMVPARFKFFRTYGSSGSVVSVRKYNPLNLP